MTVTRQRAGRSWAFIKGVPEVILERCTFMRTTHAVTALTASDRARMLQASARMAHDALRVLALAERPLDESAIPEEIEQDLIFLGLVGLQDPPRAEALNAVKRCNCAGMRTVMSTGDHPDTARAIARELGILEHGEAVVVGRELDRMDDQELTQRVPGIAVYARVTAEHKLRIVRAWKARGAVVAMTGDGVNDAPALKEASIGVAMGVTGTEVTKEAAAIIITDDNFASVDQPGDGWAANPGAGHRPDRSRCANALHLCIWPARARRYYSSFISGTHSAAHREKREESTMRGITVTSGLQPANL